MTWILSCRTPVGGVSDNASVASGSGGPSKTEADLIAQCKGQHVLIATHGFNVNAATGTENLTRWEALLTLPGNAVYIGYLWPGDSVWLHALIYPEAAKVAMESGDRLAAWLNTNLSAAASVSFVSHSLGARVVLEAIQGLKGLTVRRLLLMAGAVDDTALGGEFANAAKQVAKISNLASHQDDVLKWAFPLGNPISGIFAEGHPFWHAAIGREGPSNNPPAPAQLDVVCREPDPWNFGHGDYLPPSPAPPGYVSLRYTLPIGAPATAAVPEADTPAGYETAGVWAPYWKSAWTAGFASTRFP